MVNMVMPAVTTKEKVVGLLKMFVGEISREVEQAVMQSDKPVGCLQLAVFAIFSPNASSLDNEIYLSSQIFLWREWSRSVHGS